MFAPDTIRPVVASEPVVLTEIAPSASNRAALVRVLALTLMVPSEISLPLFAKSVVPPVSAMLLSALRAPVSESAPVVAPAMLVSETIVPPKLSALPPKVMAPLACVTPLLT